METTSYEVVATGEEEEIEDAPVSVQEFVMGVVCLFATFLYIYTDDLYVPNTDPLVIHLTHLSVSNFTSIDDAVWDADMTLKNPSSASKVQVACWESFVYREGRVVSCAVSEPVSVRPEKQRWVRLRFHAKECETQPMAEKRGVERESNSGTVRFEIGMRMMVQKVFLPDRLPLWQPGMNTTANCSALAVAFHSGLDRGNLISSHPSDGIRCLFPPQSH